MCEWDMLAPFIDETLKSAFDYLFPIVPLLYLSYWLADAKELISPKSIERFFISSLIDFITFVGEILG